MNNIEKFEKFRRLRKLFREYEAIKAEKNRRIYEIQNLLVPCELKDNYVKEYKAVIDPKIEKVEDDIFRLIDDGSITFVLNREDAIRYCSENGTTNAGYLKYAVFEHSGGGRVSIPLDILEKADRCCDEFDCDDPKNPCPFKEGGQYDWFRYCFDHGCPDIYERFHRGEYKIEIKEE